MAKNYKWTKGIDEKLIGLYERNWTAKKIALVIGHTMHAVVERLYILRKRKKIGYKTSLTEIASYEPKLNKFIKFSSDRCMIFGDVHGLKFDPAFTERMLQISRKYGLKDLAIVGDIFDNQCFSPWKPNTLTWDNEIEQLENFFKVLSGEYETIYACLGNHDEWVLNWLHGKVSGKTLFKLISQNPNFHISSYPLMQLNSNWLLIHPKSYSRTSGKVAQTLATKYQKNIMCAHGHFSSFSFDISGKYTCIDVGGITDQEKHEYVMKKITTHPLWTRGFLMMYDRTPYLFTEKSDWKFWGV